MKIPLDIVSIESGGFYRLIYSEGKKTKNFSIIDQLRKRQSSVTTPPSLKKSPSVSSNLPDRQRQIEEDILILGQISDLTKSITTPHQVIQSFLIR